MARSSLFWVSSRFGRVTGASAFDVEMVNGLLKVGVRNSSARLPEPVMNRQMAARA
jgi:hypothetical protein